MSNSSLAAGHSVFVGKPILRTVSFVGLRRAMECPRDLLSDWICTAEEGEVLQLLGTPLPRSTDVTLGALTPVVFATKQRLLDQIAGPDRYSPMLRQVAWSFGVIPDEARGWLEEIGSIMAADVGAGEATVRFQQLRSSPIGEFPRQPTLRAQVLPPRPGQKTSGIMMFRVPLARGFGCFLHVAAGTHFPKHRHLGEERVWVLEGSFLDTTVTMGAHQAIIVAGRTQIHGPTRVDVLHQQLGAQHTSISRRVGPGEASHMIAGSVHAFDVDRRGDCLCAYWSDAAWEFV